MFHRSKTSGLSETGTPAPFWPSGVEAFQELSEFAKRKAPSTPLGEIGVGQFASTWALVIVSLSGCFNPDDIFPLHGSVTSLDPVQGQPVRLLRDAVIDGRSKCDDATAFKETTTDEAGNFSFDVFRAQAQKLTGFGQFCFRVETDFPSQSLAFADLRLDTETTLPTFPDWRAQPRLENGVVHFEPLTPLPAEETLEGDQLVHRAEWLTADGGVAWVMDDRFIDPQTGMLVRVPMPLDDAALEDFSGSVRMRAQLSKFEAALGPFGGSGSLIEARSGETLQLTGSRIPVSRGLACPALGTPCPLTDGRLDAADAGTSQSLTLTLSTPVPLSAVVVRGAETDALLVGVLLKDADGGALPLVQYLLPTSTWNGGAPSFMRRPRRDGGFDVLQQSSTRYFVVALDASVPISSVTVGFAGGVSSVAEISLFEP
jgi:hypothetical protein